MNSTGGFAAKVLALCATLASAAPALALHEGLAREVRRIGALIAEEPGDAGLYLLRAEIQREMRRWPEALADLNHAARLAPDGAEHHYLRALLYRDSRWRNKARVEADSFVAARPEDARGHALRARLALAAGEPARAEADLDRALELSREPDADMYADRARAQVARGPEHRVRALAGLDAGIARLGEVPVLVNAAIELEAGLGRWDAALERLDRGASGRIDDARARREWWLAARGDLLLRAGRAEAALASFHAARRALRTLSPKRRRTRSTLALAERIDAHILAIEGSQR